MTRIEFHVIDTAGALARLLGVCRLLQRAVGRRQRVLVLGDDVDELRRLDALLWRFDPESFVPHRLAVTGASGRGHDMSLATGLSAVGDGAGFGAGAGTGRASLTVSAAMAAPHIDTVDEPVLLASAVPDEDRDCLFNLLETVPSCFSRFERTVEVLDGRDTIRTAGRERFRFYRERGYPLQHRRTPTGA